MMSRNFDIIIAGAGASGLSLLWYLLRSKTLSQKKILVVDQSLSPVNNKTWCFWNHSNFSLKDLIYHSWESLSVSAFHTTHTEKLKHHKYHCIRSFDFTAQIIDLAQRSGNVELLEAPVEAIESDSHSGKLVTGIGTFCAPVIFQSIFSPPSHKKRVNSFNLKQHFLGFEIETDKEIFDPSKALLMDFDVPQKSGVTFMYVLPFSKNKALIEYTIFSEQVLEKNEYIKEIELYLKKSLQLEKKDYKINRQEFGVIPMEDGVLNPWYNSKTYSIGTVGGLTKPTTGYTFTRIQQRCRQIVNALENNTEFPKSSISTYRYRVYDIMLLNLLNNEPDVAVQIFSDLFRRNSFDKILSFLGENTSVIEEISLFSTLPYFPFFRSIYQMKHRIFTGA